MPPTHLDPEVEALVTDVRVHDTELADRLEALVHRLEGQRPNSAVYISSGEAARRLGVSPNTIKKWVREGTIRDMFALPRSGYVKIAEAEVERIRTRGAGG